EIGIEVARREFHEELGTAAPDGGATPLGEVRQAGGKLVHAWAVPGDLDVSRMTSNSFELEWPPRSGRMQTFPEVDRAEWFDLDVLRRQPIPVQRPLLIHLDRHRQHRRLLAVAST